MWKMHHINPFLEGAGMVLFMRFKEALHMLTYLIKTTEGLLSAVVMLGLIFSYVKNGCQTKSRSIVTVGGLAGLIASIVMSVMKNTTNKIDTGRWNLRIFALALVAFVLFLLFTIGGIRKKTGRWGDVLVWTVLEVLTFTVILYALPDIWAYPFSFLTAEQTILSTDFLYKFAGYILGLLLLFVAGLAVFQSANRLGAGQTGVFLKLVLLLNAVRQVMVGLQIMLAKRMIVSNHVLFSIAKFSSNHSDAFIYGTMLFAAVIPVILWIQSFHVKEPYSNPAEHRKIRAKWRRTRRWACTTMIALFLCLMNMTAVKAIDNREVELSPVEEAAVEDGDVCVSFEQVEDGHLHRFGYRTKSGTEIRFIVIKKPNSSAYGIGLDACDICGETGYYEKDGQVVCKLCDVVMNINTIGFKGGCNPIAIDYSIANGKIRVPVAGLLEYESEFK